MTNIGTKKNGLYLSQERGAAEFLWQNIDHFLSSYMSHRNKILTPISYIVLYFGTAAKKGVKILRCDFLYFLYQNIGTVLPFLYSEGKLI